MVSLAEFDSMDADERGNRRAEASMEILSTIQDQINKGNLPGARPLNFLLSIHVEDGVSGQALPIVVPLWNNPDPVVIMGLVSMLQMWSQVIVATQMSGGGTPQ